MLQSQITRLLSAPGIRQSFVTIVGSLVASLAAAVALLILTRQFGPVAFGQFSVGFSLMLILVRLNDWGMTTVLHKFGSTKHDPKELNALFSWVTNLRFISWIVTVLVGLLCYQWLATQLRFDQPQIILFAFLLAPIAAWGEHGMAILQSLHRFSEAAIINSVQGIFKAGVAATFLLTGSLNPAWLLILYASAPTIPFFLPKLLFPPWFKIRWGALVHPEAKIFGQFAFHAAVAFVIAGVVENIDILFVQRYLNSYEVGLLAGISRIALLFAVLAYALSTVMNPRVARYVFWVDQRAFLRKAWVILIVAVLSWITLVPFTTLMINLTIGPAYSAGSSYLVWLLAASMLTVAIVPFTAMFYSIHKPWLFSVTAVIQLLIVLVGNIGFVPEYGLSAAVWTRLIARLTLLVVTILLVEVFIHRPAKAAAKQLSDQQKNEVYAAIPPQN